MGLLDKPLSKAAEELVEAWHLWAQTHQIKIRGVVRLRAVEGELRVEPELTLVVEEREQLVEVGVKLALGAENEGSQKLAG